jgi:hypothetical protein
MSDDERARRAGQNEALYRLVNEQIEGLNETFGALTGDFAIVCECGLIECHEQVTLPQRAYEQVRADPAKFVLRPGHQLDDFEDVVETGDGYVVVRKKPGTPERVAAETDPRS